MKKLFQFHLSNFYGNYYLLTLIFVLIYIIIYIYKALYIWRTNGNWHGRSASAKNQNAKKKELKFIL
jgi:hypothetical protein